MKAKTLVRVVVAILIIALIALLIYYLFFMRRGPSIVQQGPKDVGALRFLFAIYGPGVEPKPYFVNPAGMATDRFGNIYVTDMDNDRVCVFNGRGDFLFQFGERGVALPRPGEVGTWELGRFNKPYGIDIDDNTGNIYVADVENFRIQEFDGQGRPIRWFPQGSKRPRAFRPYELEVAGDKIYATTRGQINIFDLKGKFLRSLGKFGRKRNQMDAPDGVVVAKDGTIYVADKFLNRLQAFSPSGKVKWVVGRPPRGVMEQNRQFGLPGAIDIAPDGNVYVVDIFHFSIQVYSPKGKRLAEVGTMGSAPAQFYFPLGIAITNDGTMYVADKGNNRVQALKLLKYAFEEW